MDDERIIELFNERSEQAIDELSRKYGAICIKTAENIIGNTRDAEECVNDAYLAVWNKIPPESPSSLVTYLCRIVRNISISRCRYNSSRGHGGQYDLCIEELEACIPDPSNAYDGTGEKELSEHINDFLASLSETNRRIFIRRFWFLDPYDKLAKSTGLSENAVRTRISRMRDQLKDLLTERGVYYERK